MPTENGGRWDQFLYNARTLVSQNNALESRGTLTRLADEGQIVIGSGGGDDAMV